MVCEKYMKSKFPCLQFLEPSHTRPSEPPPQGQSPWWYEAAKPKVAAVCQPCSKPAPPTLPSAHTSCWDLVKVGIDLGGPGPKALHS